MSTPIFSREQTIKYAQTRLFGRNVTPDEVSSIKLYNGMLPSELEALLPGSSSRVIQDNGREPIYFSSGTLYIPQYSGFGRRRRYEEMIRAYARARESPLEFESLEREGKAHQTDIFYDNHAYNFVKGMFLSERQEITTIIFGPLDAVAAQSRVRERFPQEYVDAQVVQIAEKVALNIGYVYADQAGIIIDKMTRQFEARAREQDTRTPFSIYMFGRVGALHDNLERHTVVFPTAIIDEIDLHDGRNNQYPIHNVLARARNNFGLNLNVRSVIGETKELLESARGHGCMCVDMEIREAVESVNKARRRYDHLKLRFGFAGYVSDMPLKGDTLAEELKSDRGEQDAVRVIVEDVKISV